MEKMNFEMLSAIWQSFYLSLNVFRHNNLPENNFFFKLPIGEEMNLGDKFHVPKTQISSTTRIFLILLNDMGNFYFGEGSKSW